MLGGIVADMHYISYSFTKTHFSLLTAKVEMHIEGHLQKSQIIIAVSGPSPQTLTFHAKALILRI